MAAKSSGGLTRWFNEDWRDVKTGEKCGRSGKGKKKRPYPACRPKKAADKMTEAEKKRVGKQKTSKKRVKYPVSPTGKRKRKKPK